MAIMEGPLSKWTNVMKGWQYRWFVLDENSGLLSYYTSKEKMMRGSRRGCVRLKGAVIGIDDEDDSTFTVTVDQKTFHFQARDAEEKEKWINGLEKTILRHSQPLGFRNIDNRALPSLAQFDKKLAETDAYLQLLIEQSMQLGVKAETCPDEDAKEKIFRIKIATENMIESIKQCILLMQISKQNAVANTHGASSVHKLNGSPNSVEEESTKNRELSETKSSRSDSSNSKDTISTSSSLNICENYFGVNDSTSLLRSVDLSYEATAHLNKAKTNESVVNDTETHASTNGHREDNEEKTEVAVEANLIDFGDSKVESSPVSIRKPQEETRSDDVPMTSYSSSEDEGEFFDAEEGSPSKSKRNNKEFVEEAEIAEPSTPPPVIVSKDDEFDELYDDNDEDELESLDAHGSIIKHLISQIRIGMDLTKIVLPTFILEKRSTLEMYADFLAHPDLFVGIADQTTPKDRFVHCVRWYLSAFHAGRKSAVAKKPYNPIIGETFQCYYDLPDVPPCEEKVDGGPIPWASKENVAFISEQVSHHPPISAFYAEHYKKRISIDGYIWTKSKFLGLSIGVHMIGQAVISVLDYDEDYTITFPNGYGRSILTIPWVELGGKMNVQCVKTGYNANIEFHTKPFYGGKKDQITAELFAPGQKKPFCVVKGEWNGVMWAKYDSGFNEKFVDTKSMPIIKKRVQTLDKQTEFESRRLWKDVTINLKAKNIEEATAAKHFLEHRQRTEAKERKERGLKWETKLFHEVGEHWVYDRPLVKRLDEESAALYV